jgi:hypothetical protein
MRAIWKKQATSRLPADIVALRKEGAKIIVLSRAPVSPLPYGVGRIVLIASTAAQAVIDLLVLKAIDYKGE